MRAARVKFNLEGSSVIEGEGFRVEFEPCSTRPGKRVHNAFSMMIVIDTKVWEPPSHGSTFAVKLQMVTRDSNTKSLQVSESTHRLKKTVRRDADGNVTKYTLQTHFTPGNKEVHFSPLSVPIKTRSESVRHRRVLQRAKKLTNGPMRPYEYALVR